MVSIHHIKIDALSELERHPPAECGDEQLRAHMEKVIRNYRKLTDRRDLRNGKNKDKAWKDITDAASFLFSNGWYQHVANVNNVSAIEAIRATTNINSLWITNRAPQVEVITSTHRSTNTLDIIELEGAAYLYVTGGFRDLKSGDMIRAKS